MLKATFDTKKRKQEDHDGPISLTWPNRLAYLLLKFQPSSLLYEFCINFIALTTPTHLHHTPGHVFLQILTTWTES